MRRAPRRALERPIILAMRSVLGMRIQNVHIGLQDPYLVSRQIAYGLHHLGPAPFPQQIVLQGSALTVLLAT